MDRDRKATVTLSETSLDEYFAGSVDSAIARQRLNVDVHTRAYLVQLLTSFADRDALVTDDMDDLLDQPLALQMFKAASVSPHKRFNLLRQIGDYSLYLTGFFSGSIRRTAVDEKYYIDMGAGAYRAASAALVRGAEDNPYRQLYDGLAEGFGRYVDVLNEVSESCFAQDADILRLFDRFVSTGSRRIAARLTQLGVAAAQLPRCTQ